jgi:hypothetical protein
MSTISTLSSIESTASSDNHLQNSETIYQSLIPNQYQLQSFLDKDSNVNSDRIKTFSKVQDQDCIVPSLPASSTLAAGFEKVERSLRLLQIKLNLLTKEEVENNDKDSNVSRIVTKALQLNNCEKHETKVEDLTDSSVIISSELSPKNAEVIKSTNDIKSKLKEIDGKKKKPFIAGSRIPYGNRSVDTNSVLLSLAPVRNEVKNLIRTPTKTYQESKESQTLISQQSNASIQRAALRLEHSFSNSTLEFEPTLHLPLDLSTKVLGENGVHIKHPIQKWELKEKDIMDELSPNKSNVQEQCKQSDSQSKRAPLLLTSSLKKANKPLQRNDSIIPVVDSSTTAINLTLRMTSAKAQINLQQSRRLVFEALGQLSESEEIISNSKIFDDLPQTLTSANESVISIFPLREHVSIPLQTSLSRESAPIPLYSSLSPTRIQPSTFDSQHSLALKRSIAASLSLLPTRDDLRRVEGHLNPERFYGDLFDEIHAKEEHEESHNVVENSRYFDSLKKSDPPNTLSFEREKDHVLFNQVVPTMSRIRDQIIPSAPLHSKTENCRDAELLLRSSTIHNSESQRMLQCDSANESIVKAEKLKKELEKWLHRPPLWRNQSEKMEDKISFETSATMHKTSGNYSRDLTKASENYSRDDAISLSVMSEKVSVDDSTLEITNYIELLGSQGIISNDSNTRRRSLPSSIQQSSRDGTESVSMSTNSQSMQKQSRRLSREPWRYSRFGEWNPSMWNNTMDKNSTRRDGDSVVSSLNNETGRNTVTGRIVKSKR